MMDDLGEPSAGDFQGMTGAASREWVKIRHGRPPAAARGLKSLTNGFPEPPLDAGHPRMGENHRRTTELQGITGVFRGCAGVFQGWTGVFRGWTGVFQSPKGEIQRQTSAAKGVFEK